MENYVEKLIPIVDAIGGEVVNLYRISGGENSPLYPLLNYASMCMLINCNDVIMAAKNMKYSYSDYHECKLHGMRCLKENLRCTLQASHSSDSFTVYIPTYNVDKASSQPFMSIEAEAAFMSITSKRQTMLSQSFNRYSGGLSLERLDMEVYEWTEGLYIMISECFSRTLKTYTEYVDRMPLLKDLNRALKETPNINEMLPLKERISLNDAVHALYANNFQGKCLLYGENNYHMKKVIYIDTEKALKLKMSETSVNLEMYPYSHHGDDGKPDGMLTLKPSFIRDVAYVYYKATHTIRHCISALEKQRGRIFEICGISKQHQ